MLTLLSEEAGLLNYLLGNPVLLEVLVKPSEQALGVFWFFEDAVQTASSPWLSLFVL